MDRETFDSLTRGVGKGCTRRNALAGLAAGLFGLGVAKRVAADVATAACGNSGDNCLRNTDCCSGLKCRGGDPSSGTVGECVSKGGSKCRSDYDCARSESCIKGRCTRQDQCRQDRDCKIEQICTRGRCVNGCRGDQDCRKRNYCDRGRCVSDCARTSEYCARSSDCCSRSCYRNRCD
ncbi:MAG: hypothetical protein ACKOWF_03740 [Chloroflexota bacterium]